MNKATPYYYLRAFQVFSGVQQKWDCIRGRPYWWEGKAGRYLCIENRSCLLMFDAWEKEVKREIAQVGHGLFLDVGANIGRLSVFAGKLGMEVLALEPHRSACDALKTNLKINGVNGRALNVAAWSSETKLPFYISKSSALSNVWGKDVFGGNTALQYSVNAVTLDSLDARPSIVKIDAEFSEFEILKGMRSTVERCRPVIVYESFKGERPEKCKTLLEAWGYEVKALDGRNYVAHRPHRRKASKEARGLRR